MRLGVLTYYKDKKLYIAQNTLIIQELFNNYLDTEIVKNQILVPLQEVSRKFYLS